MSTKTEPNIDLANLWLNETVEGNANKVNHWTCGTCSRNMPTGALVTSLCGETRELTPGMAVRCPMCWTVLKTGKAPCGHRVSIPLSYRG